VPTSLKPLIPEKDYPELDMKESKVYFVDFPMVQAEILMISKGSPNFSLDEYKMSQFYNTYFGSGLSSIVFQEIRESKALAYSAYAFYGAPRKKDKSHYYQAYVGTQVDKLKDAVPAMMEIVENMPVGDDQIENAKQSILKKIETERVNKTRIYWNASTNKDRGYNRDLRKDVYDFVKTATKEDLIAFQEKHVKGRNFTFLVLGSKESVDMDYLKTIGTVEELTLEQVFGY